MSETKCDQCSGLACGDECDGKSHALLTAEPEPCEGHDGISNCLHCGGRAEIVHGMQDGWIACSKCGAAGPRRSSDEDAIAAWNRSYSSRVADKRAEDLRAENDRLKAQIAILTKPYKPVYPEPKIYESQGPGPEVWFRDVNKPNV